MGSNWLRDAGELPIVTKGSHGVFRSDDCYILLSTTIGEDGQAKSFKLSTWVGKTSKRQPDTNAKIEDLKAKLGIAGAVVEEQKQGEESEAFKSLFLFRGGIAYVEPVTLRRQQNLREDVHLKKLYWIKGKKHPRVKQIEVSAANLNHGDIFILDDDVKIYQWNGAKSNRMERGKALDLTTRLRDERMNRIKAEIVQVQDGREPADFWKTLGGQSEPKAAEDAPDDEAFENGSLTEDKLYRVADADGTMKVDLVERTAPLHRDMLEHAHAYVLDSDTEIFVWNGRDSSTNVRTEASTYAASLKGDTSKGARPAWVQILNMSQSAELALFKAKFRGVFKEYIETPDHYTNRLTKFHKIAKFRQEKINVDQLHHPEKYAYAKEDELIDMDKYVPKSVGNEHGELKIWFVKGKKLVDLPIEEYGVFYSWNCYVLQYTIRLPGSETQNILYYWLGRSASVDDKGSAAMLTADVAKSYGRSVIQCRVVQNREPEHFLSHFVDKMLVRRGKREAWAADSKDTTILYQVRGKDATSTHAVEMEPTATALSNSDVYIVVPASGKKVFTWVGSKSNEFEREITDKLVTNYCSGLSKTKIEEGNETDEFWASLGGKADYAKNFDPNTRNRLFLCSDRTSVFRVTEVEDFIQEDLNDRAVMMLDGYREVFLWVGSGCTEMVKEMSIQTAEDYIREADDGRPSNCPLLMVTSKEEPNNFYSYFQGWDHHGGEAVNAPSSSVPTAGASSDTTTVAKTPRGLKRQESVAIRISPRTPREEAPATSPRATEGDEQPEKNPLNKTGLYVDYDRLRVKPTPEGVDGSMLEAYLTLAQFRQFVKMEPADFYALPKWKQLRVKKDCGLF